MTAQPENTDPVRTALLARAGDRRRAANLWTWWSMLDYFVPATVSEMLDDAIREAERAGRVDRLLLEIMRVARDHVPSLRTSVLIDQFAAEVRTQHADAVAAGQDHADYPYLNHVDRVRAARCWFGYLTDDRDAASDAVGRELDVAALVDRPRWSVYALLSVAADLVPELKMTCLSERFAAVSTEAALDEANLLAGEGGPW